MARYREIADDLRAKIQAGIYPVGTKLPSISDLQEQYDVPALNTIRGAQQVLVDEGMLENPGRASVPSSSLPTRWASSMSPPRSPKPGIV